MGDYWEDTWEFDPEIPEPDPDLMTIMFAEESFRAEMVASRDEARRLKRMKKAAAARAAAADAARQRERPAS